MLAMVMLFGGFVLPAGLFESVGIKVGAATYGDFEYSVNSDGTVKIKSYNGSGGAVKIPQKIDGKTVTVIGDEAFWWCSNVTSVKIPNGVKKIGADTFSGCSGLKSVNIPDSVTTIGYQAFQYCDGLNKANIGNGVKSIAARAFINCPGLVRVVFGSSVSSIGDAAFDSWNSGLIFYTFSDYVVKYAKNEGIACIYLSNWKASLEPRIKPNLSTNKATLTWNAVAGAGGYEILRYSPSAKAYKLVATKKNALSHRVEGLKAGSRYRFRVRAFVSINGKKYRSSNANIAFRTNSNSRQISEVNKKIDKGYFANITSKAVKVSNNSLHTSYAFDRWAGVSDITQFVDKNGNPGFAYTKGSYLYIAKLNSGQKLTSTLKISKKYPKFGGLVCDKDGCYYVVWGKDDTGGKGGVTTMAISKYKSNGKHVKTAGFKTSVQGTPGSSNWDTQHPFDAGNCAVTLKKSVVVCSYGRQMYNGHQSNDVISVYTSSMKKCYDYYSYCSHSFDQRVMFDKYNKVWFADHGDAYPRGFKVNSFVPLHFYASASDMDNPWIYNQTNAQLGGIAETSTGVVLVGASVKGMTQSTYSKSKNLFVAYADTSQKIPGGVSRKGTCADESVTDKGIKWLTNYGGSYEVQNPQVAATDDDRVIVLWEKFDKSSYQFVQSYYMIISANGKVLQKATPMSKIRLNSCEEPLYLNGAIYWVTADNGKTRIHKLKPDSIIIVKKGVISSLTSPKSKTVKVQWKKDSKAGGYQIQIAANKNFTSGEKTYLRAKNSTTKTISSLTKGKTYYVRVRGYKKVDGKKAYGEWSAIKHVKCK